MSRRLLLLVAALFAGLSGTAASAAGAPGDYVVGGFRFFEAPMAVSAHRDPSGDLHGQLKLDNSVETLTGEVSCMTVLGNQAIVGGTVTAAQSGSQFNAFFVLEDNGAGAADPPDRVAVIVGPPPTQAFCDLILPAALALTLPVEGNIVVHDGS